MGEDAEARRAEALTKLEALRKNFAQRLVERVDELAEAVAAAADHGENTRAHALSLAHKLSGTAGSYGFPEVSVVAGDLELLLQQPAHDIERATQLVGSLHAALTQ